jgi:hypothetical protein
MCAPGETDVDPSQRLACEDTPMTTRNLPLNSWLVVEQRSPGTRLTAVSKHATQREAEAERDMRNRGLPKPYFTACIVLEPIAQRMGGRQAPTTSTRAA